MTPRPQGHAASAGARSHAPGSPATEPLLLPASRMRGKKRRKAGKLRAGVSASPERLRSRRPGLGAAAPEPVSASEAHRALNSYTVANLISLCRRQQGSSSKGLRRSALLRRPLPFPSLSRNRKRVGWGRSRWGQVAGLQVGSSSSTVCTSGAAKGSRRETPPSEGIKLGTRGRGLTADARAASPLSPPPAARAPRTFMNPTRLPSLQLSLVQGESRSLGELRLDHMRGSPSPSPTLVALDIFQGVSFTSVDTVVVLTASGVAISSS